MFAMMMPYRRGRRAEHKTQAILGDVMPAPTSEPDPPSPPQPCPMPEQRVEDTSRDKKSSASDGGHSRDEDGADTEDSDEEEQEGAYEDANPNNGMMIVLLLAVTSQFGFLVCAPILRVLNI